MESHIAEHPTRGGGVGDGHDHGWSPLVVSCTDHPEINGFCSPGMDFKVTAEALALGKRSERMECCPPRCAVFIKSGLYMVLCPLQEGYKGLETKGWKQEWPHFPSFLMVH